jgi:hypothetical protein
MLNHAMCFLCSGGVSQSGGPWFLPRCA